MTKLRGRQAVTDNSILRFVALAGLLAGQVPVYAGGFAVSEQSARAVGVAGAMTAESNDPGALFYNVASAAFQDTAYLAGVVSRPMSDFTLDSAPDSGIATQFAQQDPELVLPYAFTVQPIYSYLKMGLAVYQPFAHQADWNNINDFPGRNTSYSSRIDTIDVNPSIAVRFKSGLGLGMGVVYRTSDVTLGRRLQTQNPLNQQTVDFSDFNVDSGQEQGFGFNLGVLHRVNDRFSWGVSYRSAIEIDYSGTALLTQIATSNDDLDALLALTNPFDEDLAATSTIEFPQVVSAGIALGSADRVRVAVDLNWTGWSSFDQLQIAIPEFNAFTQTIPQEFDDTFTFRVGLQWGIGSKTELRFGFIFDESPQPDATVGPILYDGHRTTLSFGFGRDWLDVGVAWTMFASRDGNAGSDTSVAGTFEGESVLVSVAVKP